MALVDHSPPVFEKCKEDWCVFKNRECDELSPDSLSGEFQVIFKAYDFSNSTFKNGVSEIEYEFSSMKKEKGKNMFLKKHTLTFNMPIDYYITQKECVEEVRNFYSLEYPCTSVCNQGYERHFYYLLNKNKIANELYSVEDTYFNKDHSLLPGTYKLKISIKDYFGNTNTMEKKIKIVKR